MREDRNGKPYLRIPMYKQLLLPRDWRRNAAEICNEEHYSRYRICHVLPLSDTKEDIVLFERHAIPTSR